MIIRFWISLVLVIALILGPACAAKKTSANSPAPAPHPQTHPTTPKPEDYPGSHWDFDKIGERNVAAGINWYSIEKEIALGKQLADQTDKEARLIDDLTVSEYINRVGQNLVRNSDAKVPFTIKVIDADVANAFTLPGGFFYVNSGLILMVESESELAGVMAHEIAHVAARHGTRQATRGQVINIATIPLIFMGGWLGYGIRQAAGLAIPVAFLEFSRSFEEEADELGVQYLLATGYDPVSMTSVFEKLQSLEKRKKGTLAKIFSSHPHNEDRTKRTQTIISFLPARGEYAMNTSEFQEVKAQLAQLVGQRKKQDTKDREGKPTLRRKSSDKIEPGEKTKEEKTKSEEGDDRPVLKRKP